MTLLLADRRVRHGRRRARLAAGGRFGAMMLGLALACGGASALNHLLDRDIDRLMGSRTEGARSRRGG